MKRCRDCGCRMSDDHYGNICECCMDDRVPEKDEAFFTPTLSELDVIEKLRTNRKLTL